MTARASTVLRALVAALPLSCEGEASTAVPSVGATCESTCKRSVALDCPNEAYQDEASCVSQCEAQVATCSNPSIVAAYLDCIQTTTMECGSALGTASSPECVQQGLAYFACMNGHSGGDTDTVSSADTDNTETGSTTTTEIPPMPTAAIGQLVATVARAGETLSLDCTSGGVAKLTLAADTLTPGGAGSVPVPVVSAFCQTTEKRNDRSVNAVEFTLTIPSLAVGEYSIASEPPAAVTEKFRLDFRKDGSGWLFDGNKVATETYDGKVTIVENGGSGGTMRVRLEATWNQSRPFTDNVVGEPDGIPGAVAAEWAFTLP